MELLLATEKVMEVIAKHSDNPVQLEMELQKMYGLVPGEIQAAVLEMKSQEHFAELLATKINEKLNPKEEVAPSLGEVLYPTMKTQLAKNREPRVWDESKTLAQNLYPNSEDMYRGRK
jgi:ribosomal protein S3